MRSSSSSQGCIVRFRPAPATRLRLFCFPYAGGGASVYRPWLEHLPSSIELCAVQPPGREGRIVETPLGTVAEIVAATLPAIADLLDRPFALFGHSLGAATAYETARALAARGKQPVLLMVSGRQAPQLPPKRAPISHLPETEFLDAVFELAGTPQEVLADKDLVDLLMPALRADFGAAERYRPAPGARLQCPMLALAGSDDDWVDEAGLAAWAETTDGSFDRRMLPGDHFYLNRHRDLLVATIAGALTDRTPAW
jgi:surfactin synthase thioesterase subunit